MKTVLSAMQPSNRLTLGNYLGALRNWVPMQDQYKCIFFAVDLHAITLRQDPKILHDRTYRAVATYIAGGIDPAKSILFAQSHVSEHAELGWVLTCFSTMGELSRMTQFKDKTAGKGDAEGIHIPTGLFVYPVLMAADILLYNTDLVPVGGDQKQHVELTRDLAIRMNSAYGGSLFKVPEPFIPPVGARIMSLQDPTAKMSKSDPDPNATVFLDDTDDQIVKKIKRAITDSGNEITDDEKKPGVRNLLAIQSAITGRPVGQIVQQYVGKQYGHLKVETAEIVVQAVAPIRNRVDQLMKDTGELDRILKHGADQAREIGRSTLRRVYDQIGFVRPLA